ncbi:MAG: hypothetical protein KGQ49_00545 [Verrucomicrobia bacterium]|nr:hypothetical protein [Verrucomicrobiota bacterium]MBU6445869.1 hypothetical protein [Verrucomicrobiota bacterium]MDE3046929.1 hypothetical protein [Verrucomicrobiota bacterium]
MSGITGYSSDSEWNYQKEVERTFFDPSDKRPHYTTKASRPRTRHWDETHAANVSRIAQAFESIRGSNDKKERTIDCNGVPARNMVLAEARVIQSFTSSGRYYCKTPYVGDPTRPSHTREEAVRFGQQQFRSCQEVQPHRNHKGNYYTPDLGRYGGIERQLSALTNKDREIQKRLAALMLTFPRSGSDITSTSLQEALGTTPSKEDVAFVNRLCYNIFIKEVARRQLPAEGTHHAPWATALIRALKLAAVGRIFLTDIFQQNAPYGPFTAERIGEKMTQGTSNVEMNIGQINQAYRESLPTIVDARQELREIYGGASDSDDEVYPPPFQALEDRKTVSLEPSAAYPSQFATDS